MRRNCHLCINTKVYQQLRSLDSKHSGGVMMEVLYVLKDYKWLAGV